MNDDNNLAIILRNGIGIAAAGNNNITTSMTTTTTTAVPAALIQTAATLAIAATTTTSTIGTATSAPAATLISSTIGRSLTAMATLSTNTVTSAPLVHNPSTSLLNSISTTTTMLITSATTSLHTQAAQSQSQTISQSQTQTTQHHAFPTASGPSFNPWQNSNVFSLFKATVELNWIFGALGCLSAILLILYSRWRPQYFNKGVGRLILAIAVSDILYALAAIPSTLENTFCKIQGILVSTAGLSCCFILCLLSYCVFKIVTFRGNVGEIDWRVILPCFLLPLAASFLLLIFDPAAITTDEKWDRDNSNDHHPNSTQSNSGGYSGGSEYCDIKDSKLSTFIFAADIASVSISLLFYMLCSIHLYREARDLLDTRARSSKFRAMTMRLCFIYTLAGLLAFIPHMTKELSQSHLTGSTSPHPSMNPFFFALCILDSFFGPGRGMIHGLCFIMVYHGEYILEAFKSVLRRTVGKVTRLVKPRGALGAGYPKNPDMGESVNLELGVSLAGKTPLDHSGAAPTASLALESLIFPVSVVGNEFSSLVYSFVDGNNDDGIEGHARSVSPSSLYSLEREIREVRTPPKALVTPSSSSSVVTHTTSPPAKLQPNTLLPAVRTSLLAISQDTITTPSPLPTSATLLIAAPPTLQVHSSNGSGSSSSSNTFETFLFASKQKEREKEKEGNNAK